MYGHVPGFLRQAPDAVGEREFDAQIWMAAAEFGNAVNGKRIEIVSGDHQQKADVGASIARRWFDAEGVAICYAYNLGGCTAAPPGGKCPRGRHICILSRCSGAAHAYTAEHR